MTMQRVTKISINVNDLKEIIALLGRSPPNYGGESFRIYEDLINECANHGIYLSEIEERGREIKEKDGRLKIDR